MIRDYRLAAGSFVQAGVLHGTVGDTVVLAVPGGTFLGSYFSAFAGHAAERGHAVLALDVLGTGASSRPPSGDSVTTDVAATAIARVAADLAPARVIGLGHSLGAALVLRAQELAGCFEAVAVLGYSPSWVAPPRDPALWGESYVPFPRTGPDYAPVPRGLAREFGDPVRALEVTRALAVPLFLGFGELESFRPGPESAAYPRVPSVTGFVQPGAGHCHHGAMYEELLAWAIHAVEGVGRA